jgi:hypothetical protein
LRDVSSSLAAALVARQSVASMVRLWIGVDSMPNHPGVRVSVPLSPPTSDAAYILTALQEEMQVRALDRIAVRHVEVEEKAVVSPSPAHHAAPAPPSAPAPLAPGASASQTSHQLTSTVPEIRIPAGSPYSSLSPLDAEAHAARVAAAHAQSREFLDSSSPFSSQHW